MLEVRTESGTRYQIRENGEHHEVRRSDVREAMRSDHKWVKIYQFARPEIGKPMVFILEGLGELPFTERTTTPVVLIKEQA